MPKPDPQFKQNWLKLAKSRRRSVRKYWRGKIKKMLDDYLFYMGEHISDEDKKWLEKNYRTVLHFPHILSRVNSLAGKESTSRWMSVMRAVDGSDLAWADVFTEAIRSVRETCDAPEEDSTAFEDALICGMGHTETRPDWLLHPNGRITTKATFPWDVLIDPSSTSRNFGDKKFLFRRAAIPIDEFEYLFPKFVSEAMKESNSSDKEEWINNSFAEAEINIHKEGEDNYEDLDETSTKFWLPARREVLVDQYEYMVRDDHWRVVPEGGEEQIMKIDEYRAYVAEQGLAGIPEDGIDATQEERWSIRRAFIMGDKAIKEPVEIPTWGFETITCFTYRTRRNVVPFGMVRAAKSPQLLTDKFAAMMVDSVAHSRKNDVNVEEGAIEDVDKFTENLNKMGNVNVYKDDAIKEGRVLFGSPPPFPAGAAQMAEFFLGMVDSTMAVGPSLTGDFGNLSRTPSSTVSLAQQAGMSVFAKPFDNLKLYRKRMARTYFELITRYYSPERVANMVGSEKGGAVFGIIDDMAPPSEDGQPTYRVPPMIEESEEGVIWSKAAITHMRDFDFRADEAPSSPTQMRDVAAVLTNTDMMSTLAEQGMAPPPEVIVDLFISLGIPESWGEAWKNSVNPEYIFRQLVQIGFPEEMIPQLQAAIEQAAQAPEGEPQP